MKRIVARPGRQTGGGARDVAVTAVLLSTAALVWWRIVTPAVLGGGGRAGLRMFAVTALLVVPLALVAAAVGARITPRRLAHSGQRVMLARAAAAAGWFAVLQVLTVPIQRAVVAYLAPAQPNLASISYESPAVAAAHETMMHHDGLSAPALAAIHAGFNPGGPKLGTLDGVLYATQDALLVFLAAAPLALLGLWAMARFAPPAPQHVARRSGLSRLRSRWVAAAGVGILAVVGNVVMTQAVSAAVVPFAQPLKIPPVLAGSEVTVQMREANVQIMPSGPPTRMWTYNGIFPGPTFRRPSGTTTKVTFRNDMPVPFGEATIHHHGAHSASTEDGQPNSQLIPPGRLRTYTYRHVEDGQPERAVTQWYHDHRMDVTGRNVWNGLAGFFILDDAVDSALPLPKGEFDVPLMIVDRTFDANNQIPYNFNIAGTFGNTFLVNGVPQPYFTVGDRKYRFRVLNASNRAPVILSLSNGAPMIQIGTDAGLMPAPIARTQILMQPAERVEIVVDFAGMLGQNVTLVNANPAGIPPPELMQFRVNRDLTETSSVPSALRPGLTFPNPVKTRQFVVTAQQDAAGNILQWQFNGRGFDPNRIDADPVRGTTEQWMFFNNSPQPHSIHLHDVDWQLVNRFNLAFDASGRPIQGGALPVGNFEAGLKETFFLPAQQGMTVTTRFTDNLGPYMFHCHMLEHEDMALMGQFSVKVS